MLTNERIFEGSEDSETCKRTPGQVIDLHHAVVWSDALLQRWTDHSYLKSSVAPPNVGQMIPGNLLNEADRASYVSWDSETASLNTTNAEWYRPGWLWKKLGKRGKSLNRRDQEERKRVFGLQGEVRTFVGGIEVLPAHNAKETSLTISTAPRELLSSGETTRFTASDHQAGNESM